MKLVLLAIFSLWSATLCYAQGLSIKIPSAPDADPQPSNIWGINEPNHFDEFCKEMILTDVYTLHENYKINRYNNATIDSLLSGYVEEMCASLGEVLSDERQFFNDESYEYYKSLVFKKIIDVNFKSNPRGAMVRIRNVMIDIGNTNIKKPLRSENEYTFSFELDGYYVKDTTYTVPGYPRNQTVEVTLIKK